MAIEGFAEVFGFGEDGAVDVERFGGGADSDRNYGGLMPSVRLMLAQSPRKEYHEDHKDFSNAPRILTSEER